MNPKKAIFPFLVGMVMLMGFQTQASAVTFFGPSLYQSFSDSPFFAQTFSRFFLEDFEDGTYDVPDSLFTNMSAGVPGTVSSLFPSVDGDDGDISNDACVGCFGGNLGPFGVVSFDKAKPLPTHVGFALTGLDPSVNFFAIAAAISGIPGLPFADQFFDTADLLSPPLPEWQPLLFPDLANYNDDYFFGLHSPAGITELFIFSGNFPSGVGSDIHLDHIQVGYTSPRVPEPSTMLAMGLGLGLIGLTRFKRSPRPL